MQKLLKTTLMLLIASLPIQVALADSFDDAIKSVREAGESGAYFDSSYGYAVFPTIGKGGIGIGGAHGAGRVYEQGELIGEPKMTQLTVGLQLGGQKYSYKSL